MTEKSGTNSSDPYQSLLNSSQAKMLSDARLTMGVPFSDPQIAGRQLMQSEHLRFGSTSTLAKESRTRRPLMQHSLSVSSWQSLRCQSPFTLGRVWVCISIGRWTKSFRVRNGPDTQLGCTVFAWRTKFTLTHLELEIWRQYCELPEPTTERAGTPL